MGRKPPNKYWIVYLIGGKRSGRLGTVAALDQDAAVTKAIEEFGVTDPGAAKARGRRSDGGMRVVDAACPTKLVAALALS
jgi:hypothetical protein